VDLLINSLTGQNDGAISEHTERESSQLNMLLDLSVSISCLVVVKSVVYRGLLCFHTVVRIKLQTLELRQDAR
jgi:hypothetical protein